MSEDAPHWFKSSHSDFASGCVEAAHWFKSSHSSMENYGCVEAAFTGSVAVLLRDTQNRDAAVLAVQAREWAGTVRLISGRRG